jgi:hypothetical protein
MILARKRRTRAQASSVARQLALDLYNNSPAGPPPYTVGVVLQPGEQVWAQVPGRCSADEPGRGSDPRDTLWLVTNLRVAGRVHPDTLKWCEWGYCVGCQVDLTPGREVVSPDFPGLPGPVHWRGAAIAPMAVAAIVKLHGSHCRPRPSRSGDSAHRPRRDRVCSWRLRPFARPAAVNCRRGPTPSVSELRTRSRAVGGVSAAGAGPDTAGEWHLASSDT